VTDTAPSFPTQTASDSGRAPVLATLAILRRTLAQPRRRLPNLDASYDARYAVELARRLPLVEIVDLGRATDLREEGLALARSGQIDEGAALVSEARMEVEGAKLSAEARLLAEWFQTPAEAYVEYRRGNIKAAEAALYRAIELCVPLRVEYGYRVQQRRIHLARNIVRVRNSGGRPVDSLELASQLIRCVECHSEAWPWPSTMISDPDVLTLDVRLLLMDQILGDVARLLSIARADSRELLHVAETRGWFTAHNDHEAIERARTWLSARCMAVRGDWDGFLPFAGAFFAEPPGRLAMAWYELAGDLEVIAAVRTPNEIVDRSVD
jgi:hypothetical protein